MQNIGYIQPKLKKPGLLRPFSFILFSAPAGPRRLSIGSAEKRPFGRRRTFFLPRFFIISTAEELGDLAPVTDRILQNPKDFAQLFAPIFGMNIANQFQELLTQHLLIAADLVNAAKNGEPEKADIARKKWYQNADEIARFLFSIQPC